MLVLAKLEDSKTGLLFEFKFARFSLEKFLNSLTNARKFGVIVVVNNKETIWAEPVSSELEAGFDRLIKIAIKKTKSDLQGDIIWIELFKKTFFDNRRLKS